MRVFAHHNLSPSPILKYIQFLFVLSKKNYVIKSIIYESIGERVPRLPLCQSLSKLKSWRTATRITRKESHTNPHQPCIRRMNLRHRHNSQITRSTWGITSKILYVLMILLWLRKQLSIMMQSCCERRREKASFSNFTMSTGYRPHRDLSRFSRAKSFCSFSIR